MVPRETHTNESPTASRPNPENLLKKLKSGTQDIIMIMAFGIIRSNFLDPVVTIVSLRKLAIAANGRK